MSDHLDVGPLPVVRIGVASGVAGILCCAGPTVLALLGVISASTAYVWANDLYDGFSWWFRSAGLLVLVVTALLALRRRNQCTLRGVRRAGPRLAAALAIAVATYVALYAITTWLGALAT
jgi:hypothetical protein